ncbi:MAG: hypothetical protein ACRDTC_21305 [Pseudonocardiaceae bacterium]
MDRSGTITAVHRRSPAKPAWLVVDVTLGVLARPARGWIGAAHALARTLRPVTELAGRPPLLPERYSPAHLIHHLAEAGRAQRHATTLAALGYFRQLVPVVVAEILDQLDLTTLIRDRIDMDALVPGGRIGSPTAEDQAEQGRRVPSIETDEVVAAWVRRVFRQ